MNAMRSMPVGVEPDEPRKSPGRVLDPLASWRNHATKMPLIAALALVLGAPMAWRAGSPAYYAEAAVRIAPASVENLDDQSDVQLASSTQYGQFVQQQVTTIRSFDVALAALTSSAAARNAWQDKGESDRHAAERLMANISVQAVKDTYLVTIGLKGRKPDGLAEIVNAVADAYVHAAAQEGFYGGNARIERLRQQETELREGVEASVGRLAQLAEELGVSTFDDTRLNPLDTALESSRQSLDEWTRRRLAAESKLAAVAAAQERESKLELDSAARDQLRNSPAVASATRLFHERRDGLLTQVSGLSANHPGYAAIQRQLTEIDKELTRVVDKTTGENHTILSGLRSTTAATELSRAQLEVEHARRVEADMNAEYEKQRARAQAYAEKYQSAIDLVGELRRERKRIDTIRTRIDSYGLEAAAPGFVRTASSARVPDMPSAGGRKTWVMLVVVAALGLAMLVPLGLDHFEPYMVVPADLERVLGFAPTAWIATNDAGAALAREQVRRLANTIARERRTSGSTTVALSPVALGAGTDALAASIARALKRLGLRTLVVTVDQPTAGARVACRDLLTAVESPNDGVDRLNLERLVANAVGVEVDVDAVLRTLVEHYEVVLLIAPSLLISAAGERFVQAADLTLMHVGAGSVGADRVKAAAGALERLSPPAVGAVLTDVRVERRPRSFANFRFHEGDAHGWRVGQWLWA